LNARDDTDDFFIEEENDGSDNVKALADKNKEFSNPIEITKRKEQRAVDRNKEKKRLFDQYHRNAVIVDEAFEVIKINSGIQNIDEIVNTFLKAEEQNYSLYRYVDELGQENDHLTDENHKLDNHLHEYEKVRDMNASQKKNKV
jgi:hypothetical protein